MNVEKFLIIFIKFSGILEIIFGIIIIFIAPLMQIMEIPSFPFWEWSFGLSLTFMGILLWFSGKDLKRYLIIPIISIIFRLVLSCIELYVALTTPKLLPFLLSGAIYDFVSPLFTILLLFKSGYFSKANLK